jgi:glycerate 2-kinase
MGSFFKPAPNAIVETHKTELVERIMAAAVDAVDPQKAIKRAFAMNQMGFDLAGQKFSFSNIHRMIALGAGKAALGMTRGIVNIFGEHIDGGLVITKYAPSGVEKIGNIDVRIGNHPIPQTQSLEATQSLLRWTNGLSTDDLVFVLISGGASALMSAPVEGVSLEDMQNLTQRLLACGATIREINTLRKHLDRVKGGGLARELFPARVVSLILSDVVGNPLDVIASGPTVTDPSSFSDALEILAHYQLMDKVAAPIIETLENGKAGKRAETLKDGDSELDNVTNVLVGSNQIAADAAFQEAQRAGLNSVVLTTSLQGEASGAGRFLANIARQCAGRDQPVRRPACLIAGGETTVTLSGKGKGGRNQEVALGASSVLDGMADSLLVTLGTDGEDGPTDAAGAAVNGSTFRRAVQAGLSVETALVENNSYPFFERLGDLVITGPTGTNVNDLSFIFLF